MGAAIFPGVNVASEYLPLELCFEESRAAHALTWTVIQTGERIVAGIVLAFTAPVLAVAAVILVLASRRSPLIAHRRIGKSGRPFWIFKLRTMWNREVQRPLHLIERIVQDPPLQKTKSLQDPRIGNRFAAFCRRYSIDELPQLWQVVRGEMALIGPRPLTEGEIQAHYGSEANELLYRKPGITGLWQIRGRSALNYRQRRRFDLFLHRHWSLRLYLHIAAATIPAVFSGRNAW
ncbi:MAG TPA: sugar transferase [Bryobacteraceae bacterium]|jgi:lipopolysaccharide/colanic/teichoic acid biosynthesis glycosyltransferase